IFARIGKRFIINLNYVYHIEVLRQKLTLSDGEVFAYQLPISKEALKKLKDLYVTSITGKKSASQKHTEN
ncbi:MAG: LytTR family transcriptional regulator DNA-binding domain-containing protein, partial [Candidatus Paraprevotella stercoravium]|nr:LytTR family transcriptional regulator DNA-binding domain-containing protein [Candidatus Paraprevotella stercoravium]